MIVSESCGNGGVGIAVIFFFAVLKKFLEASRREKKSCRRELIVKILQKYFHNHK